MNHPKIFNTIRDKVNSMSGLTMAWLSFIIAIIGGAAMSANWVGGLVKGISGGAPLKAGWAAAIILTIALIADLWSDLIPNRKAVAGAVFLPSLSQLVHGTIGAAVHGWIDHVNVWAQQHLGQWLGETSLTAIMTLGVVGAFVLANKAAPKLAGSQSRNNAMSGRGVG